MKKILSVLLSAAMLVSVFSACGEKKKEESKTESSKTESSKVESEDSSDEGEVKEDPITISWLIASGGSDPYSEDWKVWDIIEEYGNVIYDIEAVPSSDFYTKRSLLVNTGDLPDVLARSFSTVEECMSGQFMAIDEMEAGLPNYIATLEEYGIRNAVDKTRAADGHYYSMPSSIYPMKIQNNAWMVREDIFEKNNMEIPETLDDVYEAGVQLLELYPDSYPLTNRFGSNNLMAGIANAFDTVAGWIVEDGVQYVEETDSYRYAPISDDWKNMLEYTNKLYSSGVLDQEYAILESTVYDQKAIQGTTFIFHDYMTNCPNFNTQGQEIDPDYHLVPMNPPSGTEGYEDKYAVGWTNAWTMAYMFSAEVAQRPDYDRFLEAMDWLFTEEAELLVSFGTEDMYETDANGLLVKTLPTDVSEGLGNQEVIGRVHPDRSYTGFGDDALLLKAVYEFMAENDCVPDPRPMSPLSLETAEELKITIQNLKDNVNSYMDGFIQGTFSLDADWDTFVAACESKGCNDLLAAYTDAWAARG